MPNLSLRPATDADRAFLMAVYASTRAAEMAIVPWTDEQKNAFCAQQFTAQDIHYRNYFPTAEFLVVEHDGLPVGRLYVDRWQEEIRVLDIAILPEHQRRGLGTALMQALLDEAAASGRVVSIHVEQFNPALLWYERLGFRKTGGQGIHDLMEWRAA